VDKQTQKNVIIGEKLDRQRRLMQRIQCAYEAEQKELEHLMHDEFGQSLAAIKSFAMCIKNNSAANNDITELAEIILSTSNDLYITAYDLMRSLRSGFIDNMNLLEGIQSCVENSRLAQKGIQSKINFEGELEISNHTLIVLLLRITQESLNGILRSSDPTKILISVIAKQHYFSESRKYPRNTSTDTSNVNNIPSTRDVIELHVRGISLDNIDLDNYMRIFQRAQDYTEAFGGIYTVHQNTNASIDIHVRLDVTDFSENYEEGIK